MESGAAVFESGESFREWWTVSQMLERSNAGMEEMVLSGFVCLKQHSPSKDVQPSVALKGSVCVCPYIYN